MAKPMKIIVCIPNSFGYSQIEFMMSLVALQQAFYEWVIAKKRKDSLSIILQGGHQLDKMRNDLVQTALDNDQTHILFLDADMAFPKNLIPMMISDFEDNPDVEAITGLYVWKTKPYFPHVYTTFDKETHKFNMAGQFPMNELFQVEGAGAGCLMVKAEVFKRVKAPWFHFGTEGLSEFDDVPLDKRPRLGEDLYFCLKAKPLLLCNPRIRCRHFRLTNYDIDTYIDSNGLKRTDDGFEATSEQLLKIGDVYKNDLTL